MEFFRHILLEQEFVVRANQYMLIYLLAQQKPPNMESLVGLTHERNIIFALSPWYVTKNAAASGWAPHQTAEIPEEARH